MDTIAQVIGHSFNEHKGHTLEVQEHSPTLDPHYDPNLDCPDEDEEPNDYNITVHCIDCKQDVWWF